MRFSKDTRQRAIEKLQDRTLDLLIIGGGLPELEWRFKQQPAV